MPSDDEMPLGIEAGIIADLFDLGELSEEEQEDGEEDGEEDAATVPASAASSFYSAAREVRNLEVPVCWVIISVRYLHSVLTAICLSSWK